MGENVLFGSHEDFARGVAAEVDEIAVNFDGDHAGGGMVAGDAATTAERQADFGEEAEEVGRLIENARELEILADVDGPEGLRGRGLDRASGGWNRIAVRITFGIAEIGIDAIDEQIADSVFEVFGFAVDFVPAEVERPLQEEFDEAMAAEDAQGEGAAGG